MNLKSDLDRVRKLSDQDIEASIKKDTNAAPILVDWPEDTKSYFPDAYD